MYYKTKINPWEKFWIGCRKNSLIRPQIFLTRTPKFLNPALHEYHNRCFSRPKFTLVFIFVLSVERKKFEIPIFFLSFFSFRFANPLVIESEFVLHRFIRNIFFNGRHKIVYLHSLGDDVIKKVFLHIPRDSFLETSTCVSTNG